MSDVALLTRGVDFQPIAVGSIVTAVAGIGDDGGDAAADLGFDRRYDLAQGVAVTRAAGQCGDMGDELAAPCIG